MQKDNLDLLAEQLVSEINWNDDNIIQGQRAGKVNPKTGATRYNYMGGPANQSLEDLDNKKYNQVINLQGIDGEWYSIFPTDHMQDIERDKNFHTQGSTTGQRGMNRGNRFALQYGGVNNGKYHDTDDIISNSVKNSHLISYNDFNNNPSLQVKLGKALLDFYKEKNIPEKDQPLKINYNKVKSHLELIKSLNPKSDTYNPDLAVALRNAKTPEERKKLIKQYSKEKDREYYPPSATIARADDINDDKINKIYNYRNNLSNFKDAYASLNDVDKGLFDKMQKIITNPRQTGSTQMSPKDLMLLLNNYKELSNSSKNADEIRDNWNKLRWGDLKYHEAIYDLDGTVLTEDNPNPINYYQSILFDIITRSGTFFAPQEDSMLGQSYMNIFKDHWKEIPTELIKNGRTHEIYKLWNELLEKYLLDYYIPMVINWLRSNSPLGSQQVDEQDIVNKVKSKFKSVFEFINQYDFKDRKLIIYELITGNELQHDTKAQKRLQKSVDNQNILDTAMDYYRNNGFPVDYGESIEESKYDIMITKVLKELIEQ